MIVNGRYFIDDIETGLYEVCKEEYEAELKWRKERWEAIRNAALSFKENPIIGRIQIMGTGGETKEKNPFRTLWNDSKSKGDE